jgi:hypothetical protein
MDLGPMGERRRVEPAVAALGKAEGKVEIGGYDHWDNIRHFFADINLLLGSCQRKKMALTLSDFACIFIICCVH